MAVRKDTSGTDVLYVAIRGTDDFVDIVGDIDCHMFDGYHAGFRDYAVAVYNTLRTDYGAYLKPTKRFFLTGHSLGGAAATVLSLLLHRNLGIPLDRIDVVTYGAPRSIGTQLVKDFGDKSYNLALHHPTDPVPQSFADCPQHSQHHYSHMGDLYRINHRGKDSPLLSGEIDAFGGVGGWSDFWKNVASGGIDHHDLLAYYNSMAARINPEVPVEPMERLNDTGIDWCADGSRNFLACAVAGYPLQDAQDGRDKTVKNDSDGHAGFNFTKIASDGSTLPASTTSWSCVWDNVTKLIWEIKSDNGGLRDKDWTYSWYNPDGKSNGGFADYQNKGSCSGSACDTDAFVRAVNARGLCGERDWRLPSDLELLSIVSNDRYSPAIDTNWFPNTQMGWFWSSSLNADDSNVAWIVHFDYGDVNGYSKVNAGYVRLVRGGQ